MFSEWCGDSGIILKQIPVIILSINSKSLIFIQDPVQIHLVCSIIVFQGFQSFLLFIIFLMIVPVFRVFSIFSILTITMLGSWDTMLIKMLPAAPALKELRFQEGQ